MWKINDSLIQMPEVVAEVAKELRQFFAENTNSEIASTMVWEAHKSYIRGLLIKIGSRIKKAREQQTLELLGKIRSLEATHKRSLAEQALADLTALWNQLRTMALHRAKAVIAKCRKTFYMHSNKSGKLLARALRAQRARTFIPEIYTETLTIRFTPQKP